MFHLSTWTAIGIGLGLAGAVASATLMRGLLFGVRSWDVATLASVAGIPGISSLLASFADLVHYL
jgi:hypothetical protein